MDKIKLAEHIKILIALIIAVVLQWTLRNIWEGFSYIDFPLIVIVYAALQRNSINALIFATIAGILIDSLSGGLLGASGFSKTLIAFIVSEIARRVFLDNILLRIPILAGASLIEDLVYFGLHQLLGQIPPSSFVITIAYSLVGTTITGTFIFIILESFFSESRRVKRRDFFAPRRQAKRRNPIRLGRRG